MQVHRRNNFWDYKAVEAAQAELSLTAFQLYMYLERQNTNAPWCVWPSKLAKETQGGAGVDEIAISSEAPTDENVKVWINPEEEEEAESFVKTVNGVEPDENGNVEVTGGGVSSWNDLTDKPFGDMVEVFPETEFQYAEFMGMGIFASPNPFTLVAGYDYVIRYNGVDYPCTAFDAAFNGMRIVAVGNKAAIGGENNGLPFAAAYLGGGLGAIPLDGATSVTIGIKAPRKLHPQYVPTQEPYIYEIDYNKFSHDSNSDFYYYEEGELPLALLEAAYQRRAIYIKVLGIDSTGLYNDMEYLAPVSVSANYQYMAIALGCADKTSEIFKILEGNTINGVEMTTPMMLYAMGLRINARIAYFNSSAPDDFIVYFIDYTGMD